MSEKLSRAKAIRNFIDRLDFPKASKNANLMAVISASFDLKPDSAAALLLVQTQVENFEKLLFEIELSRVGEEAKGVYRGHVGQLAKLVQYPVLYGSSETARVDIIKPNYHTLTLLSDALGVHSDINDAAKNELVDSVRKLEELHQNILGSDLDAKLKATVVPQLSALILLLKNYEVLGLDRAWEVASSSLMTLYKQAQAPMAPKDMSVLQRLAVNITLVVGILASVDAAGKHIGSIASQAKGYYEFIEEAFKKEMPRIEHKKSNDGSEDLRNV